MMGLIQTANRPWTNGIVSPGNQALARPSILNADDINSPNPASDFFSKSITNLELPMNDLMNPNSELLKHLNTVFDKSWEEWRYTYFYR